MTLDYWHQTASRQSRVVGVDLPKGTEAVTKCDLACHRIQGKNRWARQDARYHCRPHVGMEPLVFVKLLCTKFNDIAIAFHFYLLKDDMEPSRCPVEQA